MIVLAIILVLVLVLIITNLCVVQQAQAYVIERLGAYSTTWGKGLHVKLPFIERVARRVSLKEQVADFPPQPVITKDNVTMQIDTVVYFQITDPKLYTYGIEQPMVAIETLSATTLRNIIGDLELDQCLTSRDIINSKMRVILDEATDPWGIKVNRVELKNILPPREIQSAMEKQMKAERERREAILRAEGEKRAAILEAEGDRRRHPSAQRRRPLRSGAASARAGGFHRRRRRQGHQDHHPLRDPGHRRSRKGSRRIRKGRLSIPPSPANTAAAPAIRRCGFPRQQPVFPVLLPFFRQRPTQNDPLCSPFCNFCFRILRHNG